MNSLDSNSKEVLFKSFQSLIVKVLGFSAGIILSIILARILTTQEFGAISLVEKLFATLIPLGILGTNQYLTKEVSINNTSNNEININKDLVSSLVLTSIICVIIYLIILLFNKSISINIFDNNLLTKVFPIFGVAFFFQCLSRIVSAGLIGFGKIWQSNLVDQSLSVITVLLLILFFRIMSFNLNIIIISYFYLFSRIVVLSVVLYFFSKIHKLNYKGIRIKYTMINSFSFFLSSFSRIVSSNMDLLLIGFFLSSVEVAYYTVALKVSLITVFLMQVVNSAISPKIASLFASNKIRELQQMLNKITFILLIISIFIAIVIVFFGKYILAFWGEEYINAYFIVLILIFGQLINVATGAVGQLLSMTGFERINRNILFLSLIFSFILFPIFIHLFDLIGAAIVSSFITIFINVLRYYFSRKYLNLVPLKL